MDGLATARARSSATLRVARWHGREILTFSDLADEGGKKAEKS